MPLALTSEHRDLADSVAAWARRAASVESTRAQLTDLGAGKRLDSWDALVRQGLHAIHLSEERGGAGAGLPDLAVVVEQLGRALFPGPLLSTVIASAVAASLPEHPLAGELVEAYAGGATGALVATSGLSATRDGDGWVVDGTSLPVLGLPGAEIVLVRTDQSADPAAEPVWFRLADAPSAQVLVDEPTDLTRSVGRLELRGHRVGAADLLPAAAPDHLDLVTGALLAADASGVARWCVDTAVEHVSTREQFGRPVGSFQAVQHKASMMLVRAEIICAAAWDAARAHDHPLEQQRLAAAQAHVSALPAAVDTALECVALMGGIGFTWEHDTHLYWRRAISLASLGGPEEEWVGRLGATALGVERDFSFVDDDSLPDLAAEVREVLDTVVGLPDDGLPASGWAPSRGGSRQEALAAARLVAPHYPAPWGRGAGPEEQAVIAREFVRRGLAQPSTVIGEWVLPTLMVHGTPEQQERFMGPTLRGEIFWCQLFSEPGAGSDLAGLSTRARKVEGGWSLTGQKVWNSMAHEADWGVCLARTDPDAPQHQGISYFLVDMRSAGVDVRPLKQATGLSEFNEVFLDDVFVPDECLVAGPGEGWRLAVTTLSNERLSMGARLSHGSTALVRSVIDEGTHAATREQVLRVLGRCVGREMALSSLNLRSVLARLSDLDLGAEISVQKVFNAIAQRDNSRDLLSVLGPCGAVARPARERTAAGTESDPVIDHIGLPSVLFGGGTIEIQLNVIARRVLRLPR
ncbi:Acyl-CoA dehydrogenase [Nocardioides dokdonensis FR1436]|uniref:Acyl-CoA dehydrogenase n=1 Tax=Nocardioides dokdonensis FR1436 TaxID=1300347 RepID=A0A1A9GFJ4_9ACTN|nr:acyl-CoA dehydrogenase [Nocardioides dokdonensis]ANH37048.1 Acyl-CoA dehydrogenase [Nocardioides dokdonensis FR1436]